MEKRTDPKIREEITLKMGKIAERPETYNARKQLVFEDLNSMGDVYSFWIENPELRRALLLEKSELSTIKKKGREGIQKVKNGWYFLCNQGQYGKFIEVFSPEILKRLSGIVYHGGADKGEFRKRDVTLNITDYTPASWERVPERVSELIRTIGALYGEDPLEAAILAHLGIAAIQPFEDGNKRCARLVQDRILHNSSIPPAMIPAGEGTFYFQLLSKTLPAYRDGDFKGEAEFFNYCASKVNNGLDIILDDLEAR
jgi:Fic family protein